MPGTAVPALRRISAELRGLPRQWAEASTRTIKMAATQQLAGDTGGDYSLSRAPAKLRVQVSIDGTQTVTAKVSAAPKKHTSIWSWLEIGTKPHRIGQGMHPGTSGKQTWTQGTEPEVNAVMTDGRNRFRSAVSN